MILNRKDLQRAVSAAISVVPSRTTVEQLKSLYVAASMGVVSVRGSDGEVSVSARIVADCPQPFATLLPAKKVSGILSTLTADDVELSISGDKAVIVSGSSRFVLATASANEYPPMIGDSCQDVTCVLSETQARAMISQTVFAPDSGSHMSALGGLRIEAADGFRMIGTDGRRMAIAEREASGGVEIAATVPVKALNAVLRSLEGEIDVRLSASEAVFACRDIVIATKLIAGKFPDWKRVVPKPRNTLDIPVQSLMAVVRQSMIVTDENSRGVSFVIGDGNLSARSTAASVGESAVTCPVSYDGPSVEVRLSPSYIGEFLRTLGNDESVKLSFSDGDSPVVLTGGMTRYIVMPLAKE